MFVSAKTKYNAFQDDRKSLNAQIMTTGSVMDLHAFMPNVLWKILIYCVIRKGRKRKRRRK